MEERMVSQRQHAWIVTKAAVVVVLAGAIAGGIVVGVPMLALFLFHLVTR